MHGGPASGEGPQLVLAHGAGAPMTSPFMERIAQGVAARGIGVTRFEFPYMHARRESERKAGPDPQRVLLDTYREVVRSVGPAASLFIGGKSMGGRMASLIADELAVRGLVCLGYPFHPAKKPAQTRVAHLAALTTKTLIVQGTRDPLGTREDVQGYTLSSAIQLVWAEDGDHSLAPRKRSGRTEAQALDEAISAIARFIHAHG